MIVITDSRGRFLQDHLPTSRIKVLYYSGATLNNMLNRSHTQCRGRKPKYVLIMGGICNMSRKDRRTGEISLQFENESILLNHMQQVFSDALDLAHELYPSSKIMLSGLCGLDLNRCNGMFGYHRLQPVIDGVIEALNQFIVDLNYRIGAFQPKLTSKVHKRSKKQGHQNQYRFLDDGIHPGTIVLQNWGKNIFNLFSLLERGSASSFGCV